MERSLTLGASSSAGWSSFSMVPPEETLVMYTMFAVLDDDGRAGVLWKPHKDGAPSVAASQIPKTSPGSPVVADTAVALRTVLWRRLRYRQAATTVMITSRRHVPLASPAMAPLNVLPEPFSGVPFSGVSFPGVPFPPAAEDGPMGSERATVLVVEDVAVFEREVVPPITGSDEIDTLTLPEERGAVSGLVVWLLELPEW